jgi:hypothetical protein
MTILRNKMDVYKLYRRDLDILIQNFVCGDRDFIILFCSLGGSISRNSGTITLFKIIWYKIIQMVKSGKGGDENLKIILFCVA